MVDISSWQSALLHGLLQLPNPNSGVQIASQQEAWCVAGPRGLSLHTQGIIYFLKDPLTKVLHSNMDSLSPCHMVRLWRLLVSNLYQMRTQMQSWGRIPMVKKLVTFLTCNLLAHIVPGVGALERRHSSTEGGSFRGEPVVKITVNR